MINIFGIFTLILIGAACIDVLKRGEFLPCDLLILSIGTMIGAVTLNVMKGNDGNNSTS